MDFFYPFTTRYPYQNGSRNTMLKEIMNDELNYECFDCHRAYKTPEYVSLNNAIFLCADCAEIHRQLPDYISVIVPNRIKNFSNEQLKLLYYGGNRKLLEFITYDYPKLRYLDPDIMYKTEAMEYYRKYIRANAFDLEYPIKPSPNEAYRYNKKLVKKEEKDEKNFIESIQDYIDKEDSEPQKINRMGSKENESPWDTYSNKDFFKLLNKTFGGNFFGNDDEEKEDKFNKTSNFPQTERMRQFPKIEKKEDENTEMKNEESEKKEEKEEKEENVEKEEKNNNEDQEMKNEENSHPYFKRQSTDLINVPKEEKEKENENENENESDDSFMGESYYKKEDKNDKMDIEKEENKTEEEPKKEEIKIEEPKKEEIKTEEPKKDFKKGKGPQKLGSKSEIIFHSKPNINQLGSIEMYPDAEEVFLM